jgi:hypothetical protein
MPITLERALTPLFCKNVDLGLLPAIEGHIHGKLDRLLNEAMSDAVDPKSGAAIL